VRVPTNNLGRGFEEQRAEIESALLGVASSGWYVHGRKHSAFEAAFAEFLGVRHCLGVGNGTDALELALRAVDDRPERILVVTAANAGGYTSSAARSSGLVPIYADVDETTLCLSARTVEPVLSDQVRAVVITHLYGRLADVELLAALCRDRGVPLIEDCAQAVGARRNGRRAGAFGTMGTFSFYPTKNLGALGDGGAVSTDDDAIAERIRSLRQYGWDTKYVVARSGGRNSRLDEMQAAVLLARLPRVDEWNQRRRTIIGRYLEAAGGTSLRVLPADGADHAGHLAVATTERRDETRALLAAAGVATEVHYPIPDHWQGIVAPTRPPSLTVTEWAVNRVLSLPCFPQLLDKEVELVCAEISKL
jgi:dTDP-3-amino-2,3,6-trideoxy-4-keto-D-glucose/dTDP-3-amino-3,4,6-trideoxy-alpha-D-glucose/dTDP-2,6-dideoxy-D-kanosamine transaminase